MANTSNKKNPIKISVILIITASFYALFSVSLYALSSVSPGLTDKIYTNNLFKAVNLPLKLIVSAFPFSVGEILLYVCIIGFIIYLLYSVITAVSLFIKRQNKKAFNKLIQFVLILLSAALLCVGNFIVLGGINYNGSDFADKAGYTLRSYTTDELCRLCLYLGEEAGAARNSVEKNSDNVTFYTGALDELIEKSGSGYEVLCEKYSFLDGFYPEAKVVLSSEIMCYLQITGIYPYLVPEALVNKKTPASSLPMTICHEMAHQRGIAREDEANYVAYLACINSSDSLYIYSGYYSAFMYSMNQLYKYDIEKWKSVCAAVSPELFADAQYENSFWQEYEDTSPKAAKLSETVNDTYLKANDIEDGTHSYGRVVDLLLADFLSEN